MNAQERAALALWLLQQQPMTTRQMAERLGMTYEGARCLLITISRTTPIYRDDDDHLWRLVDDESGPET